MIAVIGVIAVVVIGTIGWGVGQYNNMVSADEAVGTQWANVESQYQRRSDLIPNLVNTVKGYAKHEEGTFTAVVKPCKSRGKAILITI